MASRKPAARARKIAAFKEERAASMDDIFGREEERRRERAARHEAALREKACLSKNRYPTRAEAEAAIAACADHGRRGLHCYRCDYCGGWHLTSKAPRTS